jgi:hypothetical protein
MKQYLIKILSHHHSEIKRLKSSREDYAQENINLLVVESIRFKELLDEVISCETL